jgi:hypothetical protein
MVQCIMTPFNVIIEKAKHLLVCVQNDWIPPLPKQATCPYIYIKNKKKSYTKLVHIYITTNFHLLGYELENYQKL